MLQAVVTPVHELHSLNICACRFGTPDLTGALLAKQFAKELVPTVRDW
jgi:hypothetical protein